MRTVPTALDDYEIVKRYIKVDRQGL